MRASKSSEFGGPLWYCFASIQVPGAIRFRAAPQNRFVETWKKDHPEGQVIERDLAATSLPLITDEWALAVHSDPASLTPAQRETPFPTRWSKSCSPRTQL